MQPAIQPQQLFSGKDYAVVVLNRDIQFTAEFFTKIWNNACIRHVVDGGANCFFNFLDNLPNAGSKESLMFPELASGDFDSISEESMSRLKSDARCKVLPTEDQDDTDFTKALAVLYDHMKTDEGLCQKLTKVIVICESSGRLDQIVSNLNTLHKNVFLQDTPSAEKIGVYLIGSKTLTWLLPADHQVSIKFQDEVPNLMCGIIPLMGPTAYTSQGLQWDLTPDRICSFGGLVSTSNIVVRSTIEITSIDKHSVFTVEIDESKYILPE